MICPLCNKVLLSSSKEEFRCQTLMSHMSHYKYLYISYMIEHIYIEGYYVYNNYCSNETLISKFINHDFTESVFLPLIKPFEMPQYNEYIAKKHTLLTIFK